MAEWIYFLHPPRDRFADTMTEAEAEDEDAATAIMNSDPVIAQGICRGELRPFRVLLLRGRG